MVGPWYPWSNYRQSEAGQTAVQESAKRYSKPEIKQVDDAPQPIAQLKAAKLEQIAAAGGNGHNGHKNNGHNGNGHDGKGNGHNPYLLHPEAASTKYQQLMRSLGICEH